MWQHMLKGMNDVSLHLTGNDSAALSPEVRLRLFEAIPDQARRGGGASYIISVLAGSRGAAA
jgi:hypothetical protein